MRRLRIAVMARLEDHKLASKLKPLATLPEVEELVLIRRTPLALEGLRSRCPPAALSGSALAEPWRLASLLRVLAGWPREDSFVVSFFLMPHALLADVGRRLLGVRTIPVTLSQEDVELAIQHPLLRAATRAAHAVGVRGAHSRRRLADAGFAADRLFEPPNLHDLAGFEPAGDKPADLDVVFVGGLVPVKQLDLLLRALARVKAQRPTLRAAIVGDGELRKPLEALTHDLGLSANVEFAGARPAPEVGDWMRRARLFVMTSKVEGLPMAMIEALSCGVPVVMPDVGDVTTVAKDGESACIVRAPAVESYAAAVGGLLEDEPRRARLAAGALALRERFSAEYSLGAAQRIWRRTLLGEGA